MIHLMMIRNLLLIHIEELNIRHIRTKKKNNIYHSILKRGTLCHVFCIYVYFYDNNAHPLNNFRNIPFTDYICIEYYTSQGAENNSILDDPTIYYLKRRVKMADMYAPCTKTKRISLQDAEALLYNGYVFGGHICPLCQKSQKKIAFDEYDFVDIEYVFNNSNKTDDTTSGIPFYTFYKNIGKAENGNTIYAKTYVAAIEVSGYKEYFKSQQDSHKNNWFN